VTSPKIDFFSILFSRAVGVRKISGFIDACKTNVRASLFRANFKNALYQGTTLVVPKKSSKYMGF
jgi:hypothetical protein